MLRLGDWTEIIQGDEWIKDIEEVSYRHHCAALMLDLKWYA